MKEKIDIVIYWVDGSDIEWQAERRKYSSNVSVGNENARFRDLGTLKYVFRSIEKFAPWVNKVYFVTANQKPEWLNTNNDRLVLVNHSDYMSSEYLPTFSSHPIELNIHRINGLSEKFIVLNDDCLFTDMVDATDFFVNDKPVDIFTEFPLQFKENRLYNQILFNTYSVVSKYYPNRSEYKKRLRSKILSPKYGYYFFYNLFIYFLPYKALFGITTPHFARPYTKNMFDDVWNKESELLHEVSKHKFRSETDVNIYLIRLLNLLEGNFVPGRVFKYGKAFHIHSDDKRVYEDLIKQKYKMVCINDDCDDNTFDIIKPKVIAALEQILPDKSSFER